MFNVFLRLVAILVAFVLLIAGIGSLLPREFAIEQSISIDAPVKVVFNQVNDLHHWLKWSPWRTENLGANKIHVGEPFAGEGAKLHWEDPRGLGKLWFTESEPSQRIRYELILAQFKDIRGEILFSEQGGSTAVIWKCRGRLPGGPFYGYFGRLFRVEMERQFQLSLQRLKAECEGVAGTK